MAIKQYSSLDLSNHPLLNQVGEQLSVAPSNPFTAREYFDSTLGSKYIWNGTAWVPTDASKLVNAIPNSALITNPLARANHTGTQASSTISDLATTVKAYTLDSFANPIANVAMAGYTFTGLNTAPSATGQAAEYSWVLAQLNAAQAGIDSKPSCIVLSTNNIASISGLLTIDGVTLSAGQRVLLVGQTDSTQNGPYIVASGAWSRASDVVTPQAFWFIEQGTTKIGSQWKVSTTGTITLGSTALIISQWGTGQIYTASNGVQLVGSQFSVLLQSNPGLTTSSSGLAVLLATGSGVSGPGLTLTSGLAIDTSVVARKVVATIGDGVSLSIAVTHNLGNRTAIASGVDASSYTSVGLSYVNTDANTTTFNFDGTAPGSNSLIVTIIG